jgi:hypothetical protein
MRITSIALLFGFFFCALNLRSQDYALNEDFSLASLALSGPNGNPVISCSESAKHTIIGSSFVCELPLISTEPVENLAACQNTSNASISVVLQPGSYTYQWYSAVSFTASGTLITGANSSIYTPPTSQLGTVYYYCIVSSGTNCNTTSQRSAFTVTNAQSFTATMEDRVMCSGYTASIAPNLSAYGGTYLWSNATGVINLPSYYNGILSVSPLVTTTYYLNYTIGNCVNYFDSSVVTIRPPVTVNVNNASICAGSPTTLTAAPSFGGGTYLWSNGATTPSITVSPSSTTNYSVSYTVNQCISTSSDCLDPALGNYSSRFHYLAEVFFLPPSCGCDGITYGTGYNGAPPADLAVSINGECGEFAPSLATDAAIVTVSSTPTATTATTTLCPGSANGFTVIGTPSTAVSWTTSVGGSGTFTIPAGGTAVVAPSVFSLGTSWPSGTTITLTQIALNGCVAALNSTITVTSALTASVSTTSPVCAGSTSTITFTGTPSAVVTYNIGGGNLIVALNASGTATVNTPALTSNTTVTVTQVAIAGGCSQALSNSAAIVVNSTGLSPTFPSFGPYCYNDVAPTLPTTSSNGVQGTWTPAIINTMTVGVSNYTFTPAAVGCASTPVILSVVVYDRPIVYAHGTSPTCATSCNGTAVVDVVGGTAPFSYTWSNGGTTTSLTNLCPGTYNVTVTDANGCQSQAFTPVSGCFQIQSIGVDACLGGTQEGLNEMFFIQIGNAPLNLNSATVTWPSNNFTNFNCANPAFIASANAAITAGGIILPTPVGGILPANANVVIMTSSVPNIPSMFANVSDTLYMVFHCASVVSAYFANGSAIGTRTLSMSFGAGCSDQVTYDTGPLSNSDGAYVNFSQSGAATYLDYDCAAPFTIQNNSINLVAPSPIIPTFSTVGPYCSGATIPALPTSSTNTPTAIIGTWTPAINNTATTTYTFTPSAGQCASTTALQIAITQGATVNVNSPSICFGGTATVTASVSPAGTYNYAWTVPVGASNPGNVASFNASMAGTYSVVASASGVPVCSSTPTSGTIAITPNITAGTPSSNPTLCINSALPPITIATTGATGISNAGISGANGLPVGVSASWVSNTITISGTPTAPGTFNYSIPLTGGCGAVNATGTIVVNALQPVTLNYGGPFCMAFNSITATNSWTGGGTYSAVPSGLNLNSGTGAVSFATSTAGTYTITFTPTGCAATVSAQLVLNNPPVASVTATSTICSGTATNLPLSSTPAGASFTWTQVSTAVTGASNGSGSSIAQTLTATGAVAGNVVYTVVPSLNGCLGSPVISTVTVNPLNTAATPSANPTVCPNTPLTPITIATTGATGIGAVTGLPSGLSASWNSNVITISGTPTVPGNYSYSIALTGSCGPVTASGTITVSDALDFANLQFPANGTICTTGSFSAFGQIFNTGTIATAPAGAAAGVTAQIGYSTSNTSPTTWTNWIPATFNTQSGNNDEYQGTIIGLSAGTYYYTFRYQINGCAWQYGGYNATGGGFWNGTSNVSGILTVTSPASAGNDGSISLCSSAAPINLFNSVGIASNGGTWSGPSALTGGYLGTFNPQINSAGQYTYSVSSSGCSDDIAIVNVTLNSTPTAAITNLTGTTQLGCAVQSISLLASGGTAYSWSGGLGNAANATITQAGTYTATVTNAAGCSDTESITITNNGGSLPTAAISGGSALCEGASGTVVITGTPNATVGYSINGGATVFTLLNSSGSVSISTGPLSASVTYDLVNASLGSCSQNITGSTAFSVIPAANAGNGASIQVCANGGAVNLFDILTGSPDTGGTWSGPSALTNGYVGTFNPAIQTIGMYTYTVNGSGNCGSATASVTITLASGPETTISYASPFCTSLTGTQLPTIIGAQGGSFSASPAGLTITLAGAVTPSTSVPDVYLVTYLPPAGQGCSGNAITTLVEITTPPVAQVIPLGPLAFCNGESVVLSASQGSAYNWSNGETTQTISVSTAGSYSVTLTNGANCSATSNTIDVEELASHTFYQDNDGDGFGNSISQVQGCLQEPGWSLLDGDCDDSNLFISPGADELCNDGIDNNCLNGIDEDCPVLGCIDALACNFNVLAEEEDGSCTYPGCTDVSAINYDASAGCDDGSCQSSSQFIVTPSDSNSCLCTGSISYTSSSDQLYTFQLFNSSNAPIVSLTNQIGSSEIGSLCPSVYHAVVTYADGTISDDYVNIPAGSVSIGDAHLVIICMEDYNTVSGTFPFDLTPEISSFAPGGTWFDSNLTTIPNSSLSNLNVNNLTSGWYTYVMNSGECDITSGVYIQANNTGLSSTYVICDSYDPFNLTDFLQGNPDTIGHWLDSNLNPVPNGVYNPQTMDEQLFTYVIDNLPGCSPSMRTFYIVERHQNSAGLSNSFETCEGSSPINLFGLILGNPDEGGYWTLPNGTAVFDDSLIIDASTETSGVYWYFVNSETPCSTQGASIEIQIDTLGCIDPLACNYSPTATCDDGLCTYPGCTNLLALNYDASAGCEDGSCQFPAGCTDPAACNYDAAAIQNDGSCTYPGCIDASACNFDPTAGCDDGSCISGGCTDESACNYDADAACEDGSCLYLEGSISGPQLVFVSDESAYTFPCDAGCNYQWTVSDLEGTDTLAGFVMAPSNVCAITVAWGNYTGIADLQLTVSCDNGCTAIYDYPVQVDTGIEELAANGIQLYPNPANDRVNLSVTTPWLGAKMSVYDLMGNEVASSSINRLQQEITASTWSAGIYMISLEKDGNRINAMLVKQ